MIVKNSSISEAVKVLVPEFTQYDLLKEYKKRSKNVDNLILIAYFNNNPIGYMISYDRYEDGSFYCWMTGVNPEFRNKGILKSLMNHLEEYVKCNNYSKIKIKTRNNRKEMRNYLAKNNFNIINLEKKGEVKDYRIFLEKIIN